MTNAEIGLTLSVIVLIASLIVCAIMIIKDTKKFRDRKEVYHITYVTQKSFNTPVYHSNFIEGMHPVAWILDRRKHDVYTKYHIVRYDTHPSYAELIKVQADLEMPRGNNQEN